MAESKLWSLARRIELIMLLINNLHKRATLVDNYALQSLSSSSGGNAGIMLSYALKATQSLSFAIRSSAALENMFTSPERVFEYIKIEQEANANAFDGRLSPLVEKASIAEVGPVLVAEGIVARYSRDLPPALKGVSFSIRSGRLIGICGRTGVRDK